MTDAIRQLDLLDRLVASSRRHLPEPHWAELAHAARRLRRRRHFAEVVRLVGLAGGTGSGKSSLFNALSATDLAVPGAQRPTTARPLVLMPAAQAARVERLWEELNIADVEAGSGLAYALLDLPDLDSLEGEHRRQVSELLIDLDVVVWVTDPEKYHDRVLHDQFLRPLARHGNRFVFVLNQIDRLSDREVDEVVADLAWALRRDGFESPVVLPTAAEPDYGAPIGIEALSEAIAEALADSERRDVSLRTEIERLLQLIESELAPVGFAERWREVLARAVASWPAGLAEVRRFVDALCQEAGELAVADPAEIVGLVPSTNPVELARHLDATVGRRLREGLRPRAESYAIAAELRLALADSS